MLRATTDTIPDNLIEEIVARVSHGERVRRRLPHGGRLFIDRQVPFLCLYRRPVEPDGGTEKLIIGEAAFMIGSHDKPMMKSQSALVRDLVETLGDVFGAFLIIEVRARTDEPIAAAGGGPPLPVVRIASFTGEESEHLVDVLRGALTADKRLRRLWRVETTTRAPPGAAPVLSSNEARALGCTRLILSVPSIYRTSGGDSVFPVVLHRVRRYVGVALRKTVFEFAKTRTTVRPTTFQTMGPRALVKAVWQVDAQLAEISRQFDFLLALTPTNLEKAWRSFRRAKLEKAPEFRYRPLTLDISQAKRHLFSAPLEKIEDPTVADLFAEKQLELDRQLTILADRGSKRVLFGSLQLYGAVRPSLLREAERLIELIPPGARVDGTGGKVSAEGLVARAREEIAWLRANGLDVQAEAVEIRDDISGGLMVSQGRLLVDASASCPGSRVEALIQHEVGTHVVTYYNGRCQRLQQLSVGLAGYEETQEGLAVIAEYLAGGMSKPRMRLLAGRVVAAHALVEGATFVETFRLMLRYGFSQRVAFSIVARAFRGGGLVKDAIYLRGLRAVLDHLAGGEPLELLFVGKIALHHTNIIRELQARGILPMDPFLPRYLRDEAVLARLEGLRVGRTPIDLVETRT